MPRAMPDREQLRFALMVASINGGSVPDTVMQHAIAQLEKQMIDLPPLERRRDRMVYELRRLGYSVASPEAGFYLFPRSPIPDATEFCDWLAERRVYTLPGEAFERPGFFRMSLTATDAMVDRALPILAEAIQTLSAAPAT
jgi:aspartate aminotransferase